MNAYLDALPPVFSEVRSDAMGDGKFRAPRSGRMHRGVDLLVQPSEQVRAPADGVVVRLGRCYPTEPYFGLVEIECGPLVHRVLYVEPSVEAGDEVRLGDTIGVAQDVRERHGERMDPHIHWECRLTDVLLDTGERNHHQVWINPLTLKL